MTRAAVIISSYNYACYLRQAIESALAQTHPLTQVIVVDDGSTDESPRIIDSYGQRVRAILKQHAGQASALNAGFAASDADLVIFLDSDDMLHTSAVKRAITLMSDPASKVHWPLRKIDSSGRALEQLEPALELPRGELRDVVLSDGPRSDGYLWPPTSGNAWSRRFLERVMPIPEAPYQTCPDAYLCALAPLYGSIESTAQPLASWRVHGENSTWKQPYLSRVKRYVRLWDDCCADLERHARKLGFAPQPDRWKRESWWHRLHRAADELCRIIRPHAAVVLIDDAQWGCSELDGRQVLPLIGGGGGAPADDAHAIRELESRLADGAQYVVISWSSFWWIDHYVGFTRELRRRFDCVAETDDIVVFQLRSGDHTHG